MRFRLSLTPSGEVRGVILPDCRVSASALQADVPPLVCSREFQDTATEAHSVYSTGYGEISTGTSFGKRAKQTVRDAGALLDSEGLDRVVFLTGTLPGSTAEAVAALAAWSGWTVATLKQWLRDRYPGAQSFGVWEYQKRGALHLHICVQLSTTGEARKLKAEWKQRWLKLLAGVAQNSGVDVFARKGGGTWKDSPWVVRTDAQTVEKSVGRYLSKYLSKGGEALRAVAKFPPSRWWFCDRALQRRVLEARQQLVLEGLALSTALDLFERVGGLIAGLSQSVFAYESPVNCQWKGVLGFSPPVVASILYREISGILRVLVGDGATANNRTPVPPHMVAVFFGGRLFEESG